MEASLSLETYMAAIRARVCTACLDARDDGSCGLPRHRVCAVERMLPELVQLVLSVESTRMDDYVAAVEARLCGCCPQQDQAGHCGLRARGECGLYTYLPLVVDAIQEVREGAGR